MKRTHIRLYYVPPVIPNTFASLSTGSVRDLHFRMRRANWVLLAVLAACRPSTAPVPETAPVPALPAIPPMPLAQGPLEPKVVYPHQGSMIQSRDSNFILGSVGNGNATLTING